ncbi:DUF305 domain-containing protein [Cryobacterium sp. TMT1-3]|uniref:DUF305 domain-containing protein n=1 Tax=Cryobacterium luteum TaxID=1424661 RepID=A0A1H8JNR8_9MICO|nr:MULTISPECIES: DUF305 domain-containing protein [Cryobacterium]TFB83906.1 DUF305 domain-containing protein [Cryobacterium luteum]TFC25190.1 DUF305 domain-containing protein [Cryobacterium sp. TMT1-3]SEN81838.1 Uncharacterized conserved protein, DUF305 family [Cryobacterium luteum]
MLKPRTFLYAAVALAATLTLSSCAGGSPATDSANPSASQTTAAFNSADVTFAQMMIPHHEQAVQMSDDLLAKDGIEQSVIDIATEIKAAQEPEIAQLKDWLAAWGEDESSMSGMDGMGGGSDGMMSDNDMMALQDASGVEASTLFLEQMTVHHEGAVAMAQLEIDDGENADAQAMAATIVKTQTAEIAVMAELLASL